VNIHRSKEKKNDISWARGRSEGPLDITVTLNRGYDKTSIHSRGKNAWKNIRNNSTSGGELRVKEGAEGDRGYTDGIETGGGSASWRLRDGRGAEER